MGRVIRSGQKLLQFKRLRLILIKNAQLFYAEYYEGTEVPIRLISIDIDVFGQLMSVRELFELKGRALSDQVLALLIFTKRIFRVSGQRSNA